MGEEQRVSWEELLRAAHAAFEGGTDLTVAVEEEFALLDPETLELTNRFEELHAVATQIPELALARRGRADRLGDRGSHGAVRGVCAGRRDDGGTARTAAGGGARARCRARCDGHASVEPLAGPADHRHTALPSQRRAAPLRRLAQQQLRPARARRDRRRRPRDRRARRAPELPARAARALGQLAARRGRQLRPPLGTHGDLHAHVPPLRGPRRVRQLARLRGLRRVPLPDGIDHRAHAAVVERSPAPRLPDDRDPDLRRTTRSRRGASRGGALSRARGEMRARRTTRASRCPICRTA